MRVLSALSIARFVVIALALQAGAHPLGEYPAGFQEHGTGIAGYGVDDIAVRLIPEAYPRGKRCLLWWLSNGADAAASRYLTDAARCAVPLPLAAFVDVLCGLLHPDPARRSAISGALHALKAIFF